MKDVSKEYQASMKAALRNQSYLSVNIGVINQQAQSTAFVDNQNGLYLSNYDIFGTKSRRFYYATFEKDFLKLDGSKLIPPHEHIENSTLGYISNSLVGEEGEMLHIVFADVAFVTVKGLTITFGQYYPVTFEIITNQDHVVIQDNTSEIYETDYVFEKAEYFIIKATKMQHENNRLRIERILFGIGVVFDNSNIKSATIKNYVSPISDDVPQIDFNVTIDNTLQDYNIENKTSTMNYLETGQQLDVQYGYQVNENRVEWFKLATLYLKTWSADETTAKFTAVDVMEGWDKVYNKGKYYEEGITLYDLAELVLKDLGIEEAKYDIDPYLRNVIVSNPMPKVKHKEALQIIANAGRCNLIIDEDSNIILKTSFVPDVTISSNDEHRVSSIENVILENYNPVKYASMDQNWITLDGTFKIAPSDGDVTDTMFVSNEISNEKGVFANNPIISITLEAAYTSVGLRMIFEGNLPNGLILKTYKENQLITTYEMLGNELKPITDIGQKFIDFDTMTIEFLGTVAPNSRVRLSKFFFGKFTDYTIEYIDLLKSPKGTLLDKIKDVYVEKMIYSQSNEVIKQLSKQSYALNSQDNVVTIEFNNPSYGYTVECNKDYFISVIDSGAYFIQLHVNDLNETYEPIEIIVNGYEYIKTSLTIGRTIGTRGYTKTWSNPLVSSDVLANDLLDWISSYYAADKQYELSYRGDPALEAGDIFYINTTQIDNAKSKVYEHSITFNGAITGNIKARREVYV